MSDFKITLKKAHALQLELDTIAASINVPVNVEIAPFQIDDVENLLTTSFESLFNKIEHRNLLITTRFKLRDLIDIANHKCGISSKLTILSSLQKRISVYEDIIKNSLRDITDVNALRNKLSGMSKSEHYAFDSFRVHIVDELNVGRFKDLLIKLKREKSIIKDEVDGANLTTFITIPVDIEQVLVNENLI